MSIQNGQAYIAVATCRKIDDPQNAMMRLSAMNGQFAEIFVNRDKSSLFRMGKGQYGIIAWVFLPFAHPDHVVAGVAQFPCCLAPDAAIQYQLHSPTPAVISSGSICSFSTCRRA